MGYPILIVELGSGAWYEGLVIPAVNVMLAVLPMKVNGDSNVTGLAST